MPYRAARRASTCVLVTVVAGGLILLGTGTAGAQQTSSGRTAAKAPGKTPVKAPGRAQARSTAEAISRYDAQKLGWRACLDRSETPGLPAGYYRLQCATMLAPMDWNVPGAGTDVHIAVSRLTSPAPAGSTKATTKKSPARPPADPTMLFTNPGGPGATGTDLPLLLVSAQRKKLMNSQDAYGMDPRGTGGSSNVTCGGAQDLSVDPRNTSGANTGLMLDAAQLTARACDVAGGDLIDHVNTAQTVQDVDLLRRIVGAPTVNWLGFSAGTWLAAQYATAFPGQVGHMVLDSNVEFTSTWQTAFALQPMGFQRRFESDFAPWVAKYDSVYGLGSTKDAVLASYERLRAKMTPDAPIQDAVTLDDLVAGSLYAKALFPDAAAALADLSGYLDATGSGKFTTAARYAAEVTRLKTGLSRMSLREPFSADAPNAAFLAVTCNDTPWTGDRNTLATQAAATGAAYPLIGYASIEQPCVFWNRPALSLPVPTGKGVPPVLMVQSEHDPATPIEGARIAAAGFAGARMLTVKDEGDHGLYGGGNTCVDTAVDTFLIKGKLPAEGATCKGTPLPTPTALNKMGTMSTMSAAGTKAPVKGTNPLLALREISALLH